MIPPLTTAHHKMFDQQIADPSPVTVFESFNEIKKVIFFVYSHLAKQFYSKDEYEVFYERVQKLSSNDCFLEMKEWIIDRNIESKKKPLSLTISLFDLRKVPEIVRELTTLNHIIFKNTGNCRLFDLTGWNHLIRVSYISSNRLNDAYLLTPEEDLMQDSSDRLLKIDNGGEIADDEASDNTDIDTPSSDSDSGNDADCEE